MSSVYVLEPPTVGKVVITTSLGDLDIELWPKEAPKAVRNFVQHCLDGYYDGTIFHRVIKGFMVQGGDPTGTGTGGESIYGEPFKDEVHSRLKFNHRGIVACASAGQPNSNGSQFFFTLDRCDWLDKKHTIFGKITGDTIFNAAKFGDLDADDNDRPLDPPKILSVEVLWNPFDDMEARHSKRVVAPAPEASGKPVSRIKAKGTKQLNLLSFGEEAEEEEAQLEESNVRMRSSHEMLKDPRLVVAEEVKSKLERRGDEEGARGGDGEREGDRNTGNKRSGDSEDGDSDEEDEKGGGRFKQETGRGKEVGPGSRVGGSREKGRREEGVEEDEGMGEEDRFDAKMRRQVMQKQRQLGKQTTGRSNRSESDGSTRPVPKGEGSKKSKARDDSDASDSDESDNSEGGDKSLGGKVKAERLRLRGGMGKAGRGSSNVDASADLNLLSASEQRVQETKRKRKTIASREEKTLDMLKRFQSRLKQSAVASSKKGEEEKSESRPLSLSRGRDLYAEEDEEGGDPSWMAHKLKFVVDPRKKDDTKRSDDPNDYVVHDPLLEAGKSKFNKMLAKEKKRGREWAGRSLD